MNTIHLDFLGKTARVLYQPVPTVRPKPQLRQLTKAGVVSPVRIANGVNTRLDPAALKPQDLIEGDPEVIPPSAGEILEMESLTAAYYDPESESPTPISGFKQVDVVYDASGEEKERRPHVTRKSNLDEIHPVKIGKRLPRVQALTDFVFKGIYQIVHEDGLSKDFLHGIAQELHEKEELALVGAGPKGNQPLVVRDKGSPYRAFLHGEIGTGEDEGKYKLLLLLTDQELKRPASPAPV